MGVSVSFLADGSVILARAKLHGHSYVDRTVSWRLTLPIECCEWVCMCDHVSDLVQWLVTALCCVQAAGFVRGGYTVPALRSMSHMCLTVASLPSLWSIASQSCSLADCLTETHVLSTSDSNLCIVDDWLPLHPVNTAQSLTLPLYVFSQQKLLSLILLAVLYESEAKGWHFTKY